MNARRPLLFVACAAFLAGGCREWPDYTGAFDLPSALGVLQPETGGPYQEPIGFVGNGHGGQIVPLALKQGRYLTDDPTAAFLRTNPIATGHSRLLSGIAPVAVGDTVTVFATDRAFGQLLELPFVVGLDERGAPMETEATFEPPVFVPADDGDRTGNLEGFEVKSGWVSTESWTIEFNGYDADGNSLGWNVRGTRSGRQEKPAFRDVPYVAVRRAIAFTIRTTDDPVEGDRFEVDTFVDGMQEYDLGGTPLTLRAAPDNSILAMVVQDLASGDAQLRMVDPLDPSTAEAAGSVLPIEATPGRIAWNEDGTRLFAADAAAPQAWAIDWPEGTVERIPLPWPTFDVAPLRTEDGVEQLFIVPLDEKELWVYDLETRTLLDQNAWIPGVQSVSFGSPINGIEAMHKPYLQQARTDSGIRFFKKGVAVTTAGGPIVFAEEGTGCLVSDGLGTRTEAGGAFGSAADFNRSFGADFPNGATLAQNAHNNRHVVPNPCGGIARAQGWLLRYDLIQQGWVVRGDLSGRQETLAFEDQRYVSDDGEVSFTILSGSTPSRDGWTISFRVQQGLSVALGDDDGDPTTREIVIDHPGDPVYFHYRVGPDDQGWRPVDERPHVLVAGEGSDRVGRVMPQEGWIDASWQ
jgi:hypothetical protein